MSQHCPGQPADCHSTVKDSRENVSALSGTAGIVRDSVDIVSALSGTAARWDGDAMPDHKLRVNVLKNLKTICTVYKDSHTKK